MTILFSDLKVTEITMRPELIGVSFFRIVLRWQLL